MSILPSRGYSFKTCNKSPNMYPQNAQFHRSINFKSASVNAVFACK